MKPQKAGKLFKIKCDVDMVKVGCHEWNRMTLGISSILNTDRI